MLGIPNVHGSIFHFDGQVTVFNYEDGPCYRCLYPEPPPPELAPSCAEAGVLGVLPGIIGSLQAMEVLKILLRIGEPLSGRVLIYDALATRFQTIRLERRSMANGSRPVAVADTCPLPDVGLIKPRQALARRAEGWDACWVDVRSAREWSEGRLDWIEHHTPHDDHEGLEALAAEPRPIVLVCRSDQRARLAAAELNRLGHHNPVVLEGGMLAWKLATAT